MLKCYKVIWMKFGQCRVIHQTKIFLEQAKIPKENYGIYQIGVL